MCLEKHYFVLKLIVMILILQTELNNEENERWRNTRLVHWLADVHSGSFAPAFILSFYDCELKISEANAPANRQMPIASVVWRHFKK